MTGGRHGHAAAAHGGGHAKKGENKDPWSEGNFEKTIEDRVQENQDVASAVEAIDADFERRVKELIQDRKGKVSDRFLDESHKEYDEKLVEDVRKLVDTHYDVNNRFSPLNKIVNKEGLGNSPMVKRILEDIYAGHKTDLYEHLGEKEFFKQYKIAKSRNILTVKSRHVQAATGDINPRKHSHLTDYLAGEYKVDPHELSKERMINDLKRLMISHVADEEERRALQLPDLDQKYLQRTYRTSAKHDDHAGGHSSHGGGHGGGGHH